MKLTSSAFSLACVVIWTLTAPQAGAQPGWQSYYFFLNDHPDQEENYWSHEAQGIAHDDNHWYITQDTDLWKIPVGDDLNDDSAGDNTLHVEIDDLHIGDLGYNHFGDFEHFESLGIGYLFIPITGPDGNPCNAVAVFRADTLSYVDHVCVPDASWSAFDPDGRLYFGHHSGLRRFDVDWVALHNDRTLLLQDETNIPLNDASGRFLEMPANQGGVFSPDGTLLYVTNGVPGAPAADQGIHVFDTSNWRRIQRSTNGSGLFNFEFDPTEALSDEEPEGITIWDLDDGRAPGIRGQLHVILLDNDCGCACPPVGDCDDIYLKHYTNRVYVDRAYNGTESGRIAEPFNTVAEANNFAWNGAEMRIRGGGYPENLTINKRVRMIAPNGMVRIGN